MLKPGLYEQIISQSLSRELASVSDACKHVEKLDAAEAPQALAGYVAEAVRAALEAMPSGTATGPLRLVQSLKAQSPSCLSEAGRLMPCSPEQQ